LKVKEVVCKWDGSKKYILKDDYTRYLTLIHNHMAFVPVKPIENI
jgi:hypothetical protein